MASLQQVKWGRLCNLNDDVLSTFQRNNSFGIFCCNSIKYFNNRTEKWNNTPTHYDFEESSKLKGRCRKSRAFGSNKRMYIIDGPNKINIIDFELKTCNTFRVSQLLDYVSGIIVDNKFHVIGGISGTHYIWNESLVKFDLNAESKFLADTQYHRLVYLPLRKIGLLIGGRYGRKSVRKEILSYCTTRNTWSELPVRLPKCLDAVSAVVTRDDNYVIIFGGQEAGGWIHVNSIYVLDIKMMKLLKCTVKCPVSNKVQTAILNDCNMEKLTTFGYVRDSWKNEQYENMSFPPFYLIKLIQSYYWKDEVHLFWNVFHWKISVDVILNNSTVFVE